MLQSPSREEYEQLEKAVAIMTPAEKENAKILTDEQIQRIADDAKIDVGIFAIFHGYAHGVEMPEQISAITYSAGFVIGTGLLHFAGVAIGFATRLPRGELLVRGCGGVISAIGLSYLVG